MSLTGRPSRPPFELISCSQICAPSSACWPAPASEPVCAMLKPILIGSPLCPKATVEPTAGEIHAAPMPALTLRAGIGWGMTFIPKFWTHRPFDGHGLVGLPPCESVRETDLDLVSNYLPAEGTSRCL